MADRAELIERLEDAICLATTYHEGQRDKSDEAYILHPLRVMLALDSYEEKIVGVLHDVIEDTDCILEEIQMQFGAEVAEAVDALTRRTDETYADFILRAAANPIARRVKIADIRDNLRPGCPDHLRTRYETALRSLEAKEGER